MPYLNVISTIGWIVLLAKHLKSSYVMNICYHPHCSLDKFDVISAASLELFEAIQSSMIFGYVSMSTSDFSNFQKRKRWKQRINSSLQQFGDGFFKFPTISEMVTHRPLTVLHQVHTNLLRFKILLPESRGEPTFARSTEAINPSLVL